VSHVGKLTLAGRSDPVKTCRVLSAAVSTSWVWFQMWVVWF
jgi:hypothetical protein